MALKGKLLTPERLAGATLGSKTMVDDDDLVGTTPPPDPGNVFLLIDNTGWILLMDGSDLQML